MTRQPQSQPSVDEPQDSQSDTMLLDLAHRLRQRSWDRPSPQLNPPLVETTVSDIAILVRRLGMQWIDFRPEEGIMSAEGNGQIGYSALVRSIGIILHYRDTGLHSISLASPYPLYPLHSGLPSGEQMVTTREADMLGIGILPGYKPLGIPDYRIGSIEEVYTTLDSLDSTGKAKKVVRDARTIEPVCTFGFSDLIPMAAPMLRPRGSTIIRIPIPTEHSVGLTCHKEGFVVFYNRLKAHVATNAGQIPDRRKWVLEQYEHMAARYVEWEDEVEANRYANGRSLAFLEEVHDLWDATSIYFKGLELSHPTFKYTDLMASHIRHAVHYWNDAWANMRGDEGRKTHDWYGLRDWIAEGAHMYWEYLPDIVTEMQRKCNVDESLVQEAWIMMMSRAFCWWRCHWMMHGQGMVKDASRLPSRYWDSKQPVFIG